MGALSFILQYYILLGTSGAITSPAEDVEAHKALVADKADHEGAPLCCHSMMAIPLGACQHTPIVLSLSLLQLLPS